MYDCYQHHRATEPFPNWVVRDCRLSFKKFVKSVVTSREIVYSDLSHFEEYKNKTVLIIGGGPSTNMLELDEIERDFTWSCNYFFKNEKLADTKIDLAMLMADVDLGDEGLKEYREKFKPFLGFEIHDKWLGYKFDDYENYFCMHPRFYGKLGVGPRMILFASVLGCKEIKFTGFDGYKPIYEGDHAFQPGKKTLPSSFSEELFKKQYEYFWVYVKESFETVYINLGGGEEFHETGR